MIKITIKAARVNAGYTQKEVADKLGISMDSIRYIEKNSEKIEYVMLMRLVELYGLSIDNIFLPIKSAKSEAWQRGWIE